MVEQPVGQLDDETFGPDSYNPCSFVHNNPINMTDPSGLKVIPPPAPPAPPTTGICARICTGLGTVGSWVVAPIAIVLGPGANTCADAEWHPPRNRKKCTLIGSGGCVGKKPNRTKKCTYDCGPDGQIVTTINCPPNVNEEPPCPGADGSVVTF